MPPTSRPPPLHFLVPLYSAFQLLDLAGPIDILNVLSTLPNAPPLTLTFISETLDPVPTKPIPPPSATWTFDLSPYSTSTSSAGSSKPPDVNLAFNQYLLPDITYDDYISALNTPGFINSNNDSRTNTHLTPIDVLLIPGGIGSRLTRIYLRPSSSNPPTSDPTPTRVSNIAALLSFIPLIAPHIRHSILTVCTGSHILSRTGLLNARRATTNMTRFDVVAASNDQVQWQRGVRWVRSLPSEVSQSNSSPQPPTQSSPPSNSISTFLTHDDAPSPPPSVKPHAQPSQPPPPIFNNPIYTSAGISAGMDVMLAFVAENYTGGISLARMLARLLEYEWREVGEGEKDPLYERV